ncbi:hypothetical protein [Novacetimonas pomaceti]|uniref:Uncharacterized protein n=1 Tax=Novacetimonas pomaceti TaxID=2021998 RepID=A0A318Q8K6_9PROT|nr:hypothetical protein [Novacetimonas pomaceti]PYD75080.1 hypothetical protein CFR71_11335 [Novacetimonas pomaceti]
MMKDILHALRLYASPVLFRENGALTAALFYLGVMGYEIVQHRHDVLWHDGYFTQSPALGQWWWLAQQMLFVAFALQYWRQVRSPLSAFYPRMLKGEYGAILIMLGGGMVVLALPMMIVKAPILNTLALETISLPMAVGSNLGMPKTLRPRIRWLRSALTLLVFLLFLFPKMQDRILSAPWFVALGLIIAGVILTLIELHYAPFPTPATNQARLPDTDAKAKLSRARLLSPVLDRVLRVVFWQPPWLRHMPVPQAFNMTAPMTLVLLTISMSIGFMIVATAIVAATHQRWPQWHDALAGLEPVPQFICMLSAMSLSQWLVARRNWPFLFTLGPFGHRSVFARRLYRTHFLQAIQTAVIASVLACGIAIGRGALPPSRAPAATLAVICAIMGASYVPSLTVFAARAARPGLTQMLSTVSATMGVQLAAEIFLGPDHVPSWAWLTAAALVPFCIVIAMFAPAALARADWPIEPPAL